MKRIFLILFCVLALPVMASHIVGGEFELIHISGNQYRLNLIIYFDEINGNPGAEDQSVVARIFRKRDNAVMMDVTLPLSSRSNVEYTQPDCTIGELSTRRILYTTTITLSNQNFSDPQGYYIAWERCCRNYQITNIYSENTQAGGTRYAGQTFYLEFPPVTKNGVPFYNSTPRLFPPLSDYACPRRFYYVDFAGVDDDGDSLVYSLVTPLNTKSNDALPPGGARPSPYPSVSWRPGFGLGAVMRGSPDLAITRDGFLTITPSQQGLFVFAVKCEEFRNGVRLGEVRRDFQLLVLDACPVAEPPVILGKKVSEPSVFRDNMSVSFSNQVSDADRCIQVVVSDPDALKIEDNFKEKIKLRVIPIGYKKDMSGILPEVSTAVLTADNGTKTFDICFDQCPPNESGIFQVGIIAMDDACSLPLSDTLRITVNVEPPLNSKPQFELPVSKITAPAPFNEGDRAVFRVKATDADNDPLLVSIVPDGFDMENVGMAINEIENSPGIYEVDLVWDTQCDVYDFRTKTNFELKFMVEDEDGCKFSGADTVQFNLAVILPGNADPVISTDLVPDDIVDGVYLLERKIFDHINFTVTGKDEVDNDLLVLSGRGVDFQMSSIGANFPTASGPTSVTSPFDLKLLCEKINVQANDEFAFEFIVADEANKCRIYKADTLHVKLKVLPPDNDRPTLTVTNTNTALSFENNFQDVLVGQQISLGLSATDADTGPQDPVRIELIEATGNVDPVGYIFADVTGTGGATTTFAWLPDCSIFKNGSFENTYSFTFRAYDNRCLNTKADTVTVDFRIRDVTNGNREFIPPNFISANGDSYNEYFAMVRMNESTGEFESILPVDNCVGRFVSISIYNRWGGEVFSSNNRDFQWRPVNQTPGVYFYTLIYSNREYKGTVTIRD
ncbi:MAG TPA: gliding motility-associated C-terminal domain-containing protein [Chryseosolibacter sp.]